MNFQKIFLLLWVIFALLDPDPLTRLNPDPIRIRIRNPVTNWPLYAHLMCGDWLVAGGEMTLEIAWLRVGVNEHGARPVPGGGQQAQQVLLGQRVQQAPLTNLTTGKYKVLEINRNCLTV